MKKALLITLLLIVGCSKEPINYETTLVDGDGVYYTEDTGKPYSGEVFSLYELGGRKKSETTLKDGKLDGLWTSWYWNQKKEKEGTYKDGRLDGEWTYYTTTGNGKYSITYTISDYDSIKFTDNLEIYYADFIVETDDDRLSSQNSIAVLRLPTLPWDYSNANGTYLLVPYDGYTIFPIAFRTYKDGKKDGKWTEWYWDGQKESEVTYKDGKMISSKEWNKDGSLKE